MTELIERFHAFAKLSDFRSERLLPIRIYLLRLVLRRTLPLTGPAMLIFFISSWQNENFLQLWPYILVFGLYLSAGFLRNITYPTRATLLIGLLYLYGAQEFYWNGVSGDGRMVMLTMTGLAVLFLGLYPGLGALGLSFLTQVFFGFGMPLHLIPLPQRTDVSFSASLFDWHTGNLIYLCLAGALVFCMVLVFEALVRSLKNQQLLTDELKTERNSLAARVEEATVEMQGEINERIQKEVELRSSEQRLLYLSTHDALTGLYNRAYFDSELVRLAADEFLPLSIIMGDIDRLKQTNDQHGHVAGDRLLRTGAETIKSILRRQEMIARIGGDEFAILLPNTDETETKEILHRIQEAIQHANANANPANGEWPRPLSVSLGQATAHHGGELRLALHNADLAMYSHKPNGATKAE